MATYTQGVPPITDPAVESLLFALCKFAMVASIPGQAAASPVASITLPVYRWSSVAWVRQN